MQTSMESIDIRFKPSMTFLDSRRCEVVLPETVLQEGSSVHGFHLAPWEKQQEYWESLKETETSAQGSPVSLSRMQKAALGQFCCMGDWLRRQGHRGVQPKLFEGVPDSSKIRQGRVTDCSLMSVSGLQTSKLSYSQGFRLAMM